MVGPQPAALTMPTPRKNLPPGTKQAKERGSANMYRRLEACRKMLNAGLLHSEVSERLATEWKVSTRTAAEDITAVMAQWRAAVEEPVQVSLGRHLAMLAECRERAIKQGDVRAELSVIVASAKMHGLVDDNARITINNQPSAPDNLSALPSAPQRGRMMALLAMAMADGDRAPTMSATEPGASAPRERSVIDVGTPVDDDDDDADAEPAPMVRGALARALAR